MKPIAVFTEKNRDRSTGIIGEQIAEGLTQLGVPATAESSINDNLRGRKVVNLLLSDQLKLWEAKKFVGIHLAGVRFSGNIEEHPEQKMAGLYVYTKGIPVVCSSLYHYENTANFIRSVFSPSWQKILMDDLHCVPYGVSAEFFNPKYTNDKSVMVVPYNRVNDSQKGIVLHQKVMQEFSFLLATKEKAKVECPFYIGKELRDDFAGSHPYTLLPQPTRAEYLANTRRFGLFLSTSKYESFGLYFLELLAAGAVGVFLDRPWVRKLLPDYPLIGDQKVLSLLLLKAWREFPKYQKMLRESVHPMLKKAYTVDSFCRSIITIMKLDKEPPAHQPEKASWRSRLRNRSKKQ